MEAAMYSLLDLGRFALTEFERGLVENRFAPGVTPEEALIRLPKADGTQMNAISWTVGHVAIFWLANARRFGGPNEEVDRAIASLGSVGFGSDDPTPPPLDDAIAALRVARAGAEQWMPQLDEETLAGETSYPDFTLRNTGGQERRGTAVLRTVLHAWFHTGEINAMRQVMGHPDQPFVGRMVGRMEWRPDDPEAGPLGRNGFRPQDFARFALSEMERGLEGISEEHATQRIDRADGRQMNAISWTLGHLAWHWLSVRGMATGDPVPPELMRFATGPNADPAPPSLEEGLALLDAACRSIDWIADADDAVMAATAPPGSNFPIAPVAEESTATSMMRVALHTWFHTGEVNAIRQLQGWPEIIYIGRMNGRLEWQPVG
jgi:uncharacterized damage-inducible protein DinB